MSQLQVNRINDASGGVLAPISSVMRNRIINGAMVIDQRNAGASVSTSSGISVYSVDRWVFDYSQTSKATLQQNAGSVTPPTGFTNYLGVTSSSAYSVGSSDYFLLNQRIEGFNCDLGWGTANASAVTLSFWVRSSLTGTFGGSLRNSAGNRSYPFSYTISVANTWEKKSITVAGDTTGTWLTNNGIGIFVYFSLGAGSTFSGTAGAWAGSNLVSATGSQSVVGTNGATFYITGVQLEVGTQATSFEYRQYQQELALCQRYCFQASALPIGATINGFNSTSTPVRMPVSMRTTPTLSNASFSVAAGSAGTVSTSTGTGFGTSPDGLWVFNSAGNWNTGTAAQLTGTFSAEL
jgi:hypothetical protein